MTLGNASAGAQPEANGELSLPTSTQKDQHAKNPSFIVSRLSGTCCMLLTFGINLNPWEGWTHAPMVLCIWNEVLCAFATDFEITDPIRDSYWGSLPAPPLGW